MTKSVDERIDGFIRPDNPCWHKPKSVDTMCYSYITCEHCGYDPINPIYQTPEGIQVIKDFLIENIVKGTGKDSVGFVNYFAEKMKEDYFTEDVHFDYSLNVDFAKDMILQYLNLSPPQFCKYFLEYMDLNENTT